MTQQHPSSSVPLAGSVSSAAVLFSLSLLGLLFLSQEFLLPRFTKIPVAGSLMTVADLQAQETALSDALDRAENERRAAMLPTRDETFMSLQEMKQARVSAVQLRRRIAEVAQATGGDHPKAIAIDAFVYDAANMTLRLTGAVTGVGPSSMTVLAAFVDALQSQPFVVDVVVPPFTREEGADGFRSPFTIDLTLRPSSL